MSAQSVTLEDLGRELGEHIATSDVYERYEAASRAVENDPEAQERISAFEQLRQEFMMAKQSGSADREMLRKVQNAQNELHSLAVMEEYLDAQAALQNVLEDVNRAISEPLAVDFGGEAGGCCHD
ncbi:YlbF family regulator [Halalkalirubrum salinum]|uniref:YlbF family regulator n=1 Tax=Halalkalirubrum salinum TaxID=2563889 RepID=UPI0010FB7B88|nr:YlbF family regulator [Halalkalirubrum salinum]